MGLFFRLSALAKGLGKLSPKWVIALLCALMAIHMLLRAPAFPYTPDSASYFEQARTLVRAGTALETPYGLDNTAPQPSRLFPIGYPVILALISLPGIDPRIASLALSALAGLLLPVLLFASFRRALGTRNALLLAGLSVSSPSVLTYSTLGTPDLFSLLLATATLGIVLNKQSRSWLLLGGAIAGCAYAVRNAHLALLLSIAVYYFYLGKTQATQRRETTRQALYFGSGVLLILLPVLLRNYMLFDALNPYQMEPSTVSFIHNVRTFTQEISYDLSGLRALGVLTGWSSLGAILIAGAVASAAWVYKAEWRRLTPTRTKAVFLCATYIVLGAGIVIAARTRYEWGEMINVRHTLQYTPFLWVVLLGLLPDNLSRWRTPVTLTVILLLLTSSLHLVYATVPRDLQLFNQRGLMAVAAFRNGKHFLCQSENETLTVSNWGYVFRIECDTPTRTLEMKKFQCPSSATETLPCAAHGGEIITKTLLQTSAQRAGEPIKLGFFAGRGIPPQRLALSENEFAGLEHAGFHVVRNDERGTLLSRHITH